MRPADPNEIQLVDSLGKQLTPNGCMYVAAVVVIVYLNEDGAQSYSTVISGTELDSASLLGYMHMATFDMTYHAASPADEGDSD